MVSEPWKTWPRRSIGDVVSVAGRGRFTVVGFELADGEAVTLEGERTSLFSRERFCVYAWRTALIERAENSVAASEVAP